MITLTGINNRSYRRPCYGQPPHSLAHALLSGAAIAAFVAGLHLADGGGLMAIAAALLAIIVVAGFVAAAIWEE